eukprot:IDg19903t1
MENCRSSESLDEKLSDLERKERKQAIAERSSMMRLMASIENSLLKEKYGNISASNCIESSLPSPRGGLPARQRTMYVAHRLITSASSDFAPHSSEPLLDLYS